MNPQTKGSGVQEHTGSIVFTGAHVIVGDGTTSIDGASIIVRDGVIEEVSASPTSDIPSGGAHVDLRGKTVMPTIVDPHGHIGYLRGGVTSKENYSRANVVDHLRRLERSSLPMPSARSQP